MRRARRPRPAHLTLAPLAALASDAGTATQDDSDELDEDEEEASTPSADTDGQIRTGLAASARSVGRWTGGRFRDGISGTQADWTIGLAAWSEALVWFCLHFCYVVCYYTVVYTVVNTWHSSSIGRALDRQSRGSGFGSPECRIYRVTV